MNTEIEKVKILSAGAISAKLRRMAFEIFERNFVETELVLVSIGPRGSFLAKKLVEHLMEISTLKVQIIRLDKVEDCLNWEQSGNISAIVGRKVLIVDDVLYSGKTMFSAVSKVLEAHPSGIQVAVLIDRGHRILPVSRDFVGMEMATSLKQYISMEFNQESSRAEAFIF